MPAMNPSVGSDYSLREAASFNKTDAPNRRSRVCSNPNINDAGSVIQIVRQ